MNHRMQSYSDDNDNRQSAMKQKLCERKFHSKEDNENTK